MPTDTAAWDILKLFMSGAVGGVTSTLIAQLLIGRRESSSRAQRGGALGARLAEAFHAFAGEAAKRINSHEFDDDPRETSGLRGIPASPALPEDIEGWRALDLKIAGACLAFARKIEAAQSTILDAWKNSYEAHELAILTDEQLTDLAAEADRIASELQIKYELLVLEHDFDFTATLASARARTADFWKRQSEESARVWESIVAVRAKSAQRAGDAPEDKLD